MFAVFRSLILTLACALAVSVAHAQSGRLDVTASYRERIALPDDAKLFVQLLDVTGADGLPVPVSAQLFAMNGVPVTVSLTYDPAVIDAERRYAVKAGLWSGDAQLFRTVRPYAVFDGTADGAVSIMLTMADTPNRAGLPPRRITGVRWVVTEVSGTPWSNDDPATLTVDEEMNFSIYGGCNRFTGTLSMAADQIAFPEAFAGTLMACPDDVEGQERAFISALSGVSGFVRYGAGLVLMDDTGNALLHFEERPE